jgi:hypothetical protein
MSATLLLEVLTDELGTPIVAPPMGGLPGLRHFPCPVCGGGMNDQTLLPYRPLTVADDGGVWCVGMFDRSWASATCSFTPARLAKALNRMRRLLT